MPLRFQDRDGEIFSAIFKYSGVLGRRHLKDMFWSHTKDMRSLEKRLSKLREDGYLMWPTREQRSQRVVPKGSIVWLGWKGIIWVAAQQGVFVEEPTNDTAHQLQLLKKRLAERDIRWVQEPNWNQLKHNFDSLDFRLAVERSVDETPHLFLNEWIFESELRARIAKGVLPDSYFAIDNAARKEKGMPSRARLLLETDEGNRDVGNFVRNKVISGVKFIKSKKYNALFGANTGRWLVTTTGKKRLDNLMIGARHAVGADAKLFLFTTKDRWENAGNVLMEPIWSQPGRKDQMQLFGRRITKKQKAPREVA